MSNLYLEGRHSVEAALRMSAVVLSVEIAIDKWQQPFYQQMRQLCQQKKISVRQASQREKAIFQGIAATCKYPTLHSLDDLKKQAGHMKRLLVLDHLEDPYNFAAIVRSSVGLGYEGVVFAKNRAASINAGMIQASAGALYVQKLYQVSNLAQAVGALKKKGFWVYGSALDKAQPLAKTRFHVPYCVLIGNEAKGLSKILIKECDELVKIEQEQEIDSFNASVAAGIMMYKARENSTQNDHF